MSTIGRLFFIGAFALSLCACAAQSLSPPAPASNLGARSGSWMRPEAKREKLLYVSVYSFIYGSSIYVFNYPAMTLVGNITPAGLGLCSDKKGDVYVATYGSSGIVEYAHGGTTPIKTLPDSNGLSYGCSVDPTTGNLAVTNFYLVGSTFFVQGNVLIFNKATGTPTAIQDPDIYYYYFCAYDNKGNLFIDGENTSDAFQLAEIARKKNVAAPVSLNQSIGIPGNVQWHHGQLAVGDQGNGNGTQAIYEFSISGSTGTETGATPLTGANDVPQFSIEGSSVIAPDTVNDDVAIYPYPAGGGPTTSYPFGSLHSGFGATVSNAPK